MLTIREVLCNISAMKVNNMLMLAVAAFAMFAHATPTVSRSVPKGWIEDVAKARAKAAKEGKFVFMAFSGSDWCGYCIRMDAEVFSQHAFVRQASKKYVLVMIDSPRDKSRLSALAATQNPELERQYSIGGYPSMVITDSKGKLVKHTVGYNKGGPKAFLERLDNLMAGIDWPSPLGGGLQVDMEDVEGLFVNREEECIGEIVVSEDLVVSRKPPKSLDEDNCDMEGVRFILANLVKELTAATSDPRASASLHLTAADKLLKQYTKAAGVTKEEMLESQIRLLHRMSKGASTDKVKKAFETKISSLRHQTKNADCYIADEDVHSAPDWISLDGFCVWSVPESLEVAVSDGLLDEKGEKAAFADMLKTARKMFAARGPIVNSAVKLAKSETGSDAKKNLAALDGAVAACERIGTASHGKFTYSQHEKLIVKSRVLSAYMKLLRAVASESDSAAVKSVVSTKVASLEAAAESLGKKLAKMK